jgi:hypothetical protein
MKAVIYLIGSARKTKKPYWEQELVPLRTYSVEG